MSNSGCSIDDTKSWWSTKLTAAVGFLVFLSFCNHSLAHPGDVITVDPSGNGDFTTISEAISNAFEGATIEIAPGLYQENIVLPSLIGIKLTSTNPDDPDVVANTIIRGGSGSTITCSGVQGQPVVEHEIDGLNIGNQFGGICVDVLGGSKLNLNRSDISAGGKGVSVRSGGEADLDNCTIRNQNNEQGFGNGITVLDQNSVCSLENCEVRNNMALTGGGFFVADGGRLNVDSVNFSGNQGSLGGGAGVVAGSDTQVDIVNSNFVNNQSSQGPGVIGISNGAAPNMVGNTFEGNTSGNAAMAIFEKVGGGGSPGPLQTPAWRQAASDFMGARSDYSESPNPRGMAVPMIADCTFANNITNGSFDEGAAAIICDNVSPIIINCQFMNNVAAVECGAIRNTNGASPLIQNCQFIGNIADRVAGAIMNQNGSQPMISDCTFEMNMTVDPASEGGAVVNEGASPTFTNCDFLGNLSADTGAVLSEDNSSFPCNVAFFDCNFVDNSGGAVECSDTTLNMHNCVFENNLLLAALNCSGTDATLENCQFNSNQNRGVILNDSSSNPSSFVASGCTFNNHSTSLDGAVMFVRDTNAIFTDCEFSNNSAGPNGGALLMVNSELVLKFCQFENNNCGELGGAIACFNSTIGTHIGCMFAGNSCGQSGGAVYYSESSVANYFSCAFSGNSSDQDGGAVTARDLPGDTISNCTFANNNAINGGAIFGNNNTVMQINNSILWDNGVDPIHTESGSSANVTFSNVQGGFSGTGNMDTDPLFENGLGPDGIAGTTDDDLRLQSNSPLIDAANNEAVPIDNQDLDDDGDLGEPMPFDLQMLARFVDHPDAPDVGNGDAPIVDMGAFEFSNILLGDVNLDGLVNLLDVDPFIDRVGTGTFQPEADINGDGAVNLLDVGPFIAILGS